MEAFQMARSGVIRVGRRAIPDENKRLALVGDAVLRLITMTNEYRCQRCKR
jgi:hypothetical protein